MAIKFYYAPNSTASCTEGILIELEQGGDKLAERIHVSLREGETRTEEFKKNVNPNGLVPTIVHDGTIIWESAAITMYLGELLGVERNLYPAASPKRGEIMKWIVWMNVHLAPVGSNLGIAMGWGGNPHDADEKKAREDIAKYLTILNDGLEGRKFLIGDQYTIADTHIWSFMRWLTMLKVDLGEYKNLDKWFAAVSERPLLKAWVESQTPPKS